MQHALFVPPDSSYSSLGPRTGAPDLSWQQATQRVWDSELASGMTQVCFCVSRTFHRCIVQLLTMALSTTTTSAGMLNPLPVLYLVVFAI